MLFTPTALHLTSATIFIAVSVARMEAPSSYEMCSMIPRPPSCDCSNTPDGYELWCSAFTVQVKPKAAVNIECNTNIVSDFSVLSGTCIVEADTLIIRECPLPSVSLSHVMQSLGVSSVNNVQLTYTGNSTATVTRDLFHGLSNVTSLTLHTNSTAQLTDDVFNDMPNLTFIDIKNKKLLLGKNIFCGVTKLQVLKLCSYNQAFLEPGIFHIMIHLRVLVLSGNMVNISRSVFSGLKNLESLDINSTKMINLPSDLFVDLPKLRNTNLYANEFIRLPQKLFKYNRDLDVFNLQDNRRTLNTLPPRMLGDLTKLNIVTIGNCNMSTLPKNLLWGSASIHTISLNNNAFITLPETLFKDCTKLEAVDISYNRITDLPNQIFSNATTLKYLKINNNRLSVITKNLFSPLRNLVILDLKENRLTNIETDAFEMLYHLRAVDLSNNMLTFHETSENATTFLSPLKHCHMLENIQLANNSLREIFPDWQNLKNLVILNLAYNKISHLPLAAMDFASVRNTFVNVSYNNISEIDILAVLKDYVFMPYYKMVRETVNILYGKSSSFEGSAAAIRHVYLEGNLINCNCIVSTFFHSRALIIEAKTVIAEIIIKTNSENLLCGKYEAYSEKNSYSLFSFKTFSCLLKKEYRLNCPAQCSCPLMVSGKALLVDCNQRNLSSLPKQEDIIHKLSRSDFTDVHNLELMEINSIKLSSLPSDLFLDSTNLITINIYGCEFLSLPQNLFVNNPHLFVVTIEENRRTLDTLAPRFLGNLTNLWLVTLSSCNMSTLPEDLLWGSPSIKAISLKNNAFNTLPELLFKDCTELTVLDISYNRIMNLPNGIFSGKTNLRYLKISYNKLSVITKNLFFPLRSLMFLDLKDNRLSHVEPQAFITLQKLFAVDMSNNVLTFEDTSQRQTISFSPLVFCKKLSSIRLENNSLAKIFSDWRNLRDLQFLHLAHNKISKIQAQDLDFIGSKNIYVNIRYNNISDIDIFEAGKAYKYISETEIHNVLVRHFFIEGNPIKCDCNDYRFLQYNRKYITVELKLTIKTDTSSLGCVQPESHNLNLRQEFEKILIKYFICLIKVDYSVNCPELCTCLLLTSVKAMVIECNKTNITSRENVLSNLSRDVFFGEHNLESFDFKTNGWTALTPDVFVDLTKLRKISLCADKFLRLPPNLFLNNSDLEVINIENNGQTLNAVPSGLLADLSKLKEVKIHNCNMSTLPEDLMWGSRSINTISLRNNAFATLPQRLFGECQELHHLDVSFNRIADLPRYLFDNTRKLKTLKINNNYLTVITNFLFSPLEKLEVLDLKFNRLKHIESHSFATLSSLKSVDMSNNMLTFGKTWLSLESCPNLEDIQLANNSLAKIFSDWRNLENLQTLNLAHNKISRLQDDDLHFSSTKNTFINVSYNISELHILNKDNFYKYVPVTGIYNVSVRHYFIEGNPTNCDCKKYGLLEYREDAVISQVKLTIGTGPTGPQNLQCVNPEGYTEQQNEDIPIKYFTCLSGKDFRLNGPENCSCLFRTFDKSLRVDCQQRNLTSMPEDLPDIRFSNYTEINLSKNRIKSIKYPLGPGYSKVTKYILSDNMIREIDLTALSPKVQTLELDGNRINQFNKSSVEFLMNSTFLTQLSLHNNSWRCDCTAKNFSNVIRSICNLRKIKSLENVTCENGKEILKISDTDLCPVEPKIIISGSSKVLIFGLSFALLIGCLLVLYYKFQNGIKIWLYARRCSLWFVPEAEIDQDKRYDVFVSYAYQDEDFVMDHLVPRLEDEQYTLCLHQRDWIPGEFISAQIINSVESSRRTLVVLSRSFLESVWGLMEFRVAHAQAMRDGRVRVIVILYGDIGPTDKLHSELQTYITMNTYVKWGDNWFWDKLLYAMPHSSKLCTEIPLQEGT